jgi:hypothetical protein
LLASTRLPQISRPEAVVETEGKPVVSDLLMEDAPTWVSEVSLARERTTLGNVWDNRTAATRAALLVMNELDMVGSQVRISGLPFRAEVSGWRVQAIYGGKRREKLIITRNYWRALQ